MLQSLYAQYLASIQGSLYHEDLSSEKLRCWSVPVQKEYTVQNWLGEYMGTGVVLSRSYFWLGSKGAVYVTRTPVFKKVDEDDKGVHLQMKRWASEQLHAKRG